MRAALQHAQYWKRNATITSLICFGVSLATLWAANFGYGEFWGLIAYISVIIAAISMLAAFILGVRVIQLSRDDA